MFFVSVPSQPVGFFFSLFPQKCRSCCNSLTAWPSHKLFRVAFPFRLDCSNLRLFSFFFFPSCFFALGGNVHSSIAPDFGRPRPSFQNFPRFPNFSGGSEVSLLSFRLIHTLNFFSPPYLQESRALFRLPLIGQIPLGVDRGTLQLTDQTCPPFLSSFFFGVPAERNPPFPHDGF